MPTNLYTFKVSYRNIGDSFVLYNTFSARGKNKIEAERNLRTKLIANGMVDIQVVSSKKY